MLSELYWTDRYQNGDTGWDMGQVSPPIKSYSDQLSNKQLRILIPGCGNAYEAVYLLQNEFTDVTCLDISPLPAESLKQYFSEKGLHGKVICGDFFTQHGQYDLILEQTFFCALDPGLRAAYVKKMHELLAPGGKLVGVLFDCEFEKAGPPFGGNAIEYKELFSPFFILHTFAPCYNSVAARSGRELFMILERK